MPTPVDIRRFNTHRSGARRRGIGFEMTIDEWLSVWRESGKYELRGVGIARYVMARYWDEGPYKVGNVRIIESGDNIREYWAKRAYHRGGRSGCMSAPAIDRDGREDWQDPLDLLIEMERDETLDGDLQIAYSPQP